MGALDDWAAAEVAAGDKEAVATAASTLGSYADLPAPDASFGAGERKVLVWCRWPALGLVTVEPEGSVRWLILDFETGSVRSQEQRPTSEPAAELGQALALALGL
jgi:hypothetical protein